MASCLVHSVRLKLISQPFENNLPSVSVTVNVYSDRSGQLSVTYICFASNTGTNLTGDLPPDHPLDLCGSAAGTAHHGHCSPSEGLYSEFMVL